MQSAWVTFLQSLDRSQNKNPVFLSILRGVRLSEEKDTEFILTCESIGQLNYLEKRKKEIEEMIVELIGKTVSVSFIMHEEKKEESGGPLLDFQPTRDDVARKAGINPHFTFQNFAVSGSNQVAFAAAQSVSQMLGSSYNPLFLYGGVGVGKTHLAQAVAQTVLEKNPELHVFFCSGERFMNELIESIREKNTVRFRKKYRSLQLIIIDDIQFIAGKQTVQEEFFHTFNSIVSAGGQIILTSDRHPHEIKNLEDRLRSRFSGGLIVDIQQPDFELRTAILLIKAKEKNIDIDMDAAKAVAENVVDTRSLEGMLLSLYAQSLTKNRRIDLELIDVYLNKKTGQKKQTTSPQDIMKAVGIYYNIKISHLKGDSRKSEIAFARQVAMYLLRKELGLNLEDVARLVKRRDHTTVIHAVNKIQKAVIKDPAFKEEIDTIARSVKSST